MKINIDMEAWELATVIKGLTINAQPEEKKPSGTGWITNLKPEAKSVLSDKTREELKKAIASAFKVPDCLISDDNPNPNYRPPMGGSHRCDRDTKLAVEAALYCPLGFLKSHINQKGGRGIRIESKDVIEFKNNSKYWQYSDPRFNFYANT